LHCPDPFSRPRGVLAGGPRLGPSAPRGGAARSLGARGRGSDSPRSGGGRPRMTGAVLLAATLAFADSVPRLTLAEALERATRLDPNYVRALGQISTAEWARRSAKIVFVLPSVSVGTDYSTFSIPQFNLGTGSPAKTIVTARADARLE